MFLHAEFMYKPRPPETDVRARKLFDVNLAARLGCLHEGDTALFICDSKVTFTSIAPLLERHARLQIEHVIANPQPRSTQTDMPLRCGWEMPDAWRQMEMSDRWARILVALRRAAAMGGDGYLIMPAHEAVYRSGLFARLIALAQAKQSQTGKRYAVSPIDHMHYFLGEGSREAEASRYNVFTAAFDREMLDHVCEGGQGFWGKLGIVPLAVCGDLARAIDTDAWEDDLEIDGTLHELGHGTACLKVPRSLYQLQYGIPFFQTTDHVRATILRHLHYSLKIPGERPSALQSPPSQRSLYRARTDAGYARALEAADALIAECDAEMRGRVAQYGCSWVDWGAYRYVARPRDPAVEVWKRA
jgi:hypothetical protein